jgi:hypothetical protein
MWAVCSIGTAAGFVDMFFGCRWGELFVDKSVDKH